MKKTIKTIFFAILVAFLSGCGLAEDLGKHCGGSLDHLCYLILGGNSTDIEDIDKRLKDLEKGHASAVSQIEILSQDINNNQALINTLQTQANSIQTQVTQLQLNENITEIYDPCGPHSGYDEVLLKTSSGKFIAYFEVGQVQGNQKRFLSVLEENIWLQTTDTQACIFKVVNSEIVYQ